MQLKGIYAPIVTPFHADESVNYPVLEQLIEYLIANKIAGLVPGGTTGEVYAWSEQERLDIFKFVKEKVNRRVTLIAGTAVHVTWEVERFVKKIVEEEKKPAKKTPAPKAKKAAKSKPAKGKKKQ